MTNNTNPLLTWLRDFKNIWLLENIPNNSHLLQTIQTKLTEFEQLIIDTNEDEEEYHRAKLLNDHSSNNSDTEQIAIASTSIHQPPHEPSLPTPPDISNQLDSEEQFRQALLEQSDISEKSSSDEDIVLLRPALRLKRISQADAELYMPSAWKNTTKSSNSDDCHLVSSSSSNSATSDDDFRIKFRTRKPVSNKTEKSPIKLRKHTTNSHKTKDVIINYNLSTISHQSSIDDSLTHAEDISPMDEDRILKDVIQNKDNDSVFGSIDVAPDKTTKNNSNHDNEDLSNDKIQLSSSEESSDDRPSVEVPSYAHLLNHSKSSSNSDADHKKKKSLNDQNRLNNSKSSHNSDGSRTKKKSKKQRVLVSSLSSSSDEDENKSPSTTRTDASDNSKQQASSSHRIEIERSSTSDDESNPRLRQRRKKPAVSTERSNILKQIKRKKAEKENSISASTTDNSSDNHTKTKKSKRNSSDDDDKTTTDDDELSPSKRKHGRKNIRKILDDKELDNQTKEAIDAERERLKRIAEKQKEYNDSLLDQSSYMATNIDDEEQNNSNHRLILELDKTTNEPLIEVSPKLVEQLKPHQAEGIRFLWNNVFESIDAIKNKKQNGNGCILAHCMGLGKTLQVISFIHTVLNYDKITKVKTCLVLCPINAALNWTNEFEYWLKDVQPPVDHYQLTTIKANLRVSHLNYWYENGGVVIMGYEMYRRLANGFNIKSKKLKAEAYKCLVDPGPDIVVADEGHILKNAQTALAKCLSKIKTPRRIVLTGTPLQNNLIEYYCMVSFIKPSLLGSQSEYINRFVNPIQNGQHRDSNEEDVRLMKRRACVLHGLLTGFVDRKDYSLLKEYLPPKFEYIINIRLSDLQSKLYEIYLKELVDKEQRLSVLKKDFKSAKLFADYQYLQKIWTHPFLLYPHFIDRWKKRFNKDEDSIIDDNDLDAMFVDDEDNIEGNKKSNGKQRKPESENKYSGFLIDNITNESKDVKPSMSKSTKRRTSNSSTTTLDSNPIEDDNDIIEEINSDSKSKKSGDDDDDDDIEIIKSYPTRSRTTMNNPSSKTMNSNVFDTENDQVPAEMSTNDLENCSEPWLDEMREQFWYPFLDALPEESKYDIELSGKFLILKFILDKCAEIGDKILLFSRSLYTLTHIEKFLKHLQIQNEKEYQKQCESRRQLRELLASNEDNDQISNEQIPEPIEWIRDRDYFRMDGQTEVITRKRYAKAFNDMTNLRARVFLISTLAGGIGINLTGSNRVIVFDASWNPSHDTQAIFRSYRFGQKKPVYIYRLLAHGTMEEKIYQRQVVKQSISQRVVDDHQLDRHFTQNDIKELYKFKPEKLPEPRSESTLLTDPTTDFNYPIPKDHLLLDLLYEHNRWIHSYHSHDSLLENKLDEGLSAEERHRALEEYENLKRLPDQRQIALQRFQQQQQLNALIARQQQQSAAAQATRVHQTNVQQLCSEIFQTVRAAGGQYTNFNQALQFINQIGFGKELTNNATKSTNKRPQKSNMHLKTTATPVPILPRPPTANPNDVIIVDSDEETGGNDNANP